MISSTSHASNLPLFTNNLPDNTRRAVLACALVREYRAGEVICVEGAPADAIYFVVSGLVYLDRQDSDAPTALAVGESFGESEVVRRVNYTVTAIAVSDSQLWVLEKCALDALFEKHAAFALALSRHIALKLEYAQQQFALPTGSRVDAAQPARTRRAASSRGAPRQLALAALIVFFLSGVVLTGLTLGLATTINVEGLALSAPAASSEPVAAKPKRPKVAQWIGIEPIRAPVEPAEPQTKPVVTQAHVVSAGDTLSGIAQMHGTTLAVLRTLNNLNGDVIRVGVQVSVPQGDQPPRGAVALPTRPPRPLPTPAPPSAKPAPTQPAPAAPAMAVPVAPTPPPRTWQMPAWSSVEDAKVAPGQKYYRLVKAIYFDEASAGGRVNILVGVLDESGKPMPDISVKMEWGANEFTTRKTEDKKDPFLLPYNLDVVAVHDMASGSSFSPDRGERGGYTITVEGLPSDGVSGMGLPLRHHVAFLLVFQRTSK